MSALYPPRRAERFAVAVDADRDSGLPAAAVTSRDVALLELVATMRTTARQPVAPGAAFTADLRERLLLAAETDLVPADPKLLLKARPPRRREARLSAAAAAVVVLIGSAGVATAAGSTVPGEVLYPIKRGVEQARSSLAFSDAARGRSMLGDAAARLDEVGSLVSGRGDPTQALATLDSFHDSAGHGADLLFSQYQAGGDADDVIAVRDFTGTAMGDLQVLAADAPAELRQPLAQAASLVADLDQQASVLCAACGPREVLTPPTDLALAASTFDELLDATPAAPVAAAGGTGTPTGSSGAAGSSAGTATSGSGGTTKPGTGSGASTPLPVEKPTIKPPDLGGVVTGAGGSGTTSTKDPVGDIVDQVTGTVGGVVPSVPPSPSPSAGGLLGN